MICDTFTTESRERRVSLREQSTLPGAEASARFDVITATTTVWMRLALKSSACTTRTGRRYPGPEPVGLGREAHQISPRRITTVRFRNPARPLALRRAGDPFANYAWRRLRQACPSLRDGGPWQGLAQWPWNKSGCGKFRGVWNDARRRRKASREWRWRSSYPEYNLCYTSNQSPRDLLSNPKGLGLAQHVAPLQGKMRRRRDASVTRQRGRGGRGGGDPRRGRGRGRPWCRKGAGRRPGRRWQRAWR
jgi:hypothetical protein